MAPAVNVDVAHNTIAALAAESLLAVTFLGCGLISLHRQIVMGDLQLLVGRFGVQFEWLAYLNRRRGKERKSD